MAISEQLILDLGQAQAQIDDLERQLDGLLQPIDIPVNIETTQALDELRRDIQATDAEEVDVDVDIQGLAQADDELGDFNRELRRTEDELEDVARESDRATEGVLRLGTRGASVFSNLRGSLLAVGAGFAAFQGLQAVGQFFSESITAASELEQAIGGVRAIFGESSDTVLAFGEDAALSVGLAESAFNQLSSQLGAQLQAFGFGIEESAEQTTELIELGADLAATFGGPVSQAVEAIGSLLRGERNPIERYGVALNEATIQAQALEQGLAATASELTLQDKALASLSLLYEQTTGAQGQFAREADTTAGALERIRALFENASATVGEALVPAFNNLLEILPPLIDLLEDGLAPAIAGVSASAADVDPSGFVAFLANLPTAAERLAGGVNSGAQAVGNLGQALGELVTLDPVGAFTQLSQAAEDFADVQFDSRGLQTIQDLITTLTGGVEPAEALEAALFDLGQRGGLPADRLEELGERLLTIADAAGISAPELETLAGRVEEFGVEAGFSEPAVEALVALLEDLARDKGIEAQLDRDVSGLLRLAGAARESAPAIERNEEAVAAFADRVGEIRAGQLAEELEGVGGVFSALPDQLDAAAEALRNEENEIVTDFSDFLENLEEEIAAQQAFRENLAILRALGLDSLEQVFADAGLDAAGALADAVANPEEARRAEDLLDAQAVTIGNSFVQTLIDTIEGQGLDLSLAADATVAINSLVVSGLDRAAAQAEVGRQVIGEIGGVGGAGVVVNQTFEAGASPTTETARASQIANSVISSAPRVN